MSRRIVKKRKHITTPFLTIAISSMSVFFATSGSPADEKDILKIIKIEPQRKLTVNELVLIKGKIEGKEKIDSVEITSNCSKGTLKKIDVSSSNEWSADFRFNDPRKECEIKATGKDKEGKEIIPTDSFNVEVVGEEEQLREILDKIRLDGKQLLQEIKEIDIESLKTSLFLLVLPEILIFFLAAWFVFKTNPDIQKKLPDIQDKLTTIDKNLQDIRTFKLLKPTLDAFKPKSIPIAGGWHKLTGAGFTVGTKVFDVDNNKYLDKAYIDSSTLIVQWPSEAANTKKQVEIRGEFGQSKKLEVEYSDPPSGKAEGTGQKAES